MIIIYYNKWWLIQNEEIEINKQKIGDLDENINGIDQNNDKKQNGNNINLYVILIIILYSKIKYNKKYKAMRKKNKKFKSKKKI